MVNSKPSKLLGGISLKFVIITKRVIFLVSFCKVLPSRECYRHKIYSATNSFDGFEYCNHQCDF